MSSWFLSRGMADLLIAAGCAFGLVVAIGRLIVLLAGRNRPASEPRAKARRSQPLRFHFWRYAGQIAAGYIIINLAMVKGWLTIFAMALCAVLAPPLLALQLASDIQLARGTAHRSVARLASIQLVGLLLFFLGLPGVGDDNSLVFGIFMAGSGDRLLFYSSCLLGAAGALAFLAATGMLCIRLFKRAD